MEAQRKRVLVVDDSETLRKLVNVSLRVLEGCDVIEAPNGFEALRLLREQKIDLAIIDIHMPEMSGLQLLGFMKSDPSLSSIPVVILTTERGEEDRRRGMELGASRYLVKPFRPRVLMEVVRELLQTKG
ncbi:MAG: response regulator [Armatimonadota bacterium]|nr:response regulator [Armatimonadota bacterium]MCX7778125.1 response regulator [Armatimonadota bacterium]MDW8024837.1 response regulator [Armatimonadota bacterium]